MSDQDDHRPVFLCLRLLLVLLCATCLVRPDTTLKKKRGAGRHLLQRALRHRRSGRHFLVELARADPASTTEGQELLDEPGVRDFSRNGYRYLTSSPFVANAFRNFLGPSFSKELMNELVRSAERQFYDGSKGAVTEAMAAETLADDDFGDSSDTELEDAGSEKGGRSDVVIPTALRQAVRRLHEKHRAHWPERW